MLFALEAFLAGIVLAVIESTFINAIEFMDIRPDIAVLAVVVATNRAGFRRAIMLAFMLGVTRDFFSGGAIGMNAFSLTFMAYFLVFAKEYLMTETWPSQIFVAFLGSLFFGVLIALLKLVLQYESGSVPHILGMISWTSLYTSLCAPLAFTLMKKRPFPSYLRLKLKYGVKDEILPEDKI